MRFVYITSLILTILIIQSLSISAKDIHTKSKNDTMEISCSKIYFPVREIKIHENYMNNPTELEHIKHYLAESPRIDSITIYSYASPEGNTRYNYWLATERAKTAKCYILKNIPEYRNFPDSLIRLRPTAENWVGMREEIVALYDRFDKAQVLEIIDRKGISDAQRKQLLMALDNGKSWRYILKNIMPQLRYATWMFVWQSVFDEPTQYLSPRITPLEVSTIEMDVPQKINIELRNDTSLLCAVDTIDTLDTKTILALKTNLLFSRKALLWITFKFFFQFLSAPSQDF